MEKLLFSLVLAAMAAGLAACVASADVGAAGEFVDRVDPMIGSVTYAKIEAAVAASDRAIADAQAGLKDAASLADYARLAVRANGTNVWTAALQTALREHEIVRIPAAAEPYYIDASVLVPSNRRVEAYGATVALLPGTRTLMLRNEHAPDGTLAPVPADSRDRNIAIVGGRWEDWTRRRLGYGATGCFDLAPRKVGAHYGVSTLFYFGNCDDVLVRDVTFAHTSAFAVQSGDGARHGYERIRFESCYADGLHLNGNLENVHVRDRLRRRQRRRPLLWPRRDRCARDQAVTVSPLATPAI
jgi:hypothetical protein